MKDDAEEAARRLAAATAAADAGHVNRAALEEAGQLAVTFILARTKAGIDARGQRFRGYTEEYARRREKALLQRSPVDLTRSGHMLGSIGSTVQGNEVVVDLASRSELPKAVAHNLGRGKNPERRFMDLTHDERIALAQIIGEGYVIEIVKALKP